MGRGKIGWMAIIALVFMACQQDKWEMDESLSVQKEEMIPVTFNISLASGMKLDSEIVPMNITRAEGDTVLSHLSNAYKAIVVKKIDTRWIIDRIVSSTLMEGSPWSEILLKRTDILEPLQLELRPGKYRLVIFLNASSGKWNQTLKPGMVVEDEKGTVERPQVMEYFIGGVEYPNRDLRTLSREIFTGYVDFSVQKTDHFNADPYENLHSVQVTRKVGCFRIILKENPGERKYGDTEQSFRATFVAADGMYFPDGLDIWGNAWYDKTNLCRSIDVCMISRYPAGRTDYLVSSWVGVTVFSPYYFADDRTEGLPYTVRNIRITGQSGVPYQVFRFKDDYVASRILRASYIDGIVLQPTDETYADEETQTGVCLVEVNEDPAKLFGPFMEWNNKY